MSPNVSIFHMKNAVCNLKSAIHCSIKDQSLHSTQERGLANYQPSLWSYDFIQSLQNDNADDLHKEKAKEVEVEVRCLIKTNKNESDEEIIKKLELMDDIQRLGMRFLFEDEIKEGLYNILHCGGFANLKSLHSTSLLFRLLRQHGYHISQDVLKEFIDEKGEIVEWLRKDWKGILSLYEASFMGMEGEDVLDKARKQTFIHLNHVQKNDINIGHALELPLNKRMVMLEVRWHIESYAKREHPNDSLLQLAILNFNMVQALLQSELKEMSVWWNQLQLANKLGFSRDRLMECFFWAVGIMYEPQFSSCRKVLTKVASFVTTIDDVYDVYGTLDELELFTLAVQRWDVNGLENMPDYMKLCYLSLYNTVNEIAYDTLKERQRYVLPYLTKAWGDLCKSFLKEAEWRHEKKIPSFDEYLENGCVSVSGIVFIIHAYCHCLMIHNNSNPAAIHCLLNHHELLRTSSLIFRLCNDLATSSDEIGRGEVSNAISCYMNEKGASEEEARKHIKEMIDKAWKNMNKYKLDETHPNNFPVELIETAINLARIAQCTYQHGDGHGSPDSTSYNRVLTLIIQPIS
ncbi:Isoprene synthase chloroplastic [Euphorbia peplus]|nr:Isoprene synthase chloroplastic [Euphorbia peplus]